MVSIKDVARLAGVSPQTVSNCLNNPTIVKPTTRELVSTAISRLGYTPNASARRLRTQRSNTIAIGISPVSHSRVYDRLLHALVTEADFHNIRVMLYKTDSKQEELRQFEELTNGGDVDSFVLTDTAHDDLRPSWLIEHHQAFVLFGRPWGMVNMYDPQVPWVDVDGQLGIAEVTRYLILHGRKHIGFIGWPGVSGTGESRRAGWRDTILEARMAQPEEIDGLCAYGEEYVGTGQAACVELLAQRPDIDAIVCVSDTLATGAMMALPQECNVIVTGFDNTDAAQSLGIPTVDQPLTDSAREIVRIIREQLSVRDTSSISSISSVSSVSNTGTGTKFENNNESSVRSDKANSAENNTDRLHVLLPPRIIVNHQQGLM